MYVYYESFMYKSNTSTMLSKSIYVHEVTCHENGNERLFNKLCRLYGSKNVSSNARRGFNKIYVRFLARKIVVKYLNQKPYHNPEFAYSYVDNNILGYRKEKNNVPKS